MLRNHKQKKLEDDLNDQKTVAELKEEEKEKDKHGRYSIVLVILMVSVAFVFAAIFVSNFKELKYKIPFYQSKTETSDNNKTTNSQSNSQTTNSNTTNSNSTRSSTNTNIFNFGKDPTMEDAGNAIREGRPLN